jgi:hypothetical protein
MEKMSVDVPTGAAMVVFVDADGIIIDAVDSNGQSVQAGPDSACPLAESRFGSSCPQTSVQTDPTSMQRGARTQAVPCCWRKVSGHWICKPEYC